MSIVPDRKDWTWVLMRPCEECGLDVRGLRGDEVPELLRANAEEWGALLEDRSDVRDRPSPDVWSPLEYACHVRDVCRLYDRRLMLMLAEDDPTFANWDQDQTALEDLYAGQDPAVVRPALMDAAATLSLALEGVNGAQWDRTGRRSDGAEFTVDSFARYFIHDPVHHLFDVRRTP